ANAPELKAYQWIYQRPPNAWPILSGSVALGDHSPAVMVLVDAASPLRVITAAQLGMLFCGKTVPHWRDLGVKGALAGRPIRPVLPDTESGTGRFLRHALFGDATAFAWGRVREAADPAARVAGDLSTLALAGGPPPSGTRRIPILDGATPRTVDDPRYPLARTVYAYGDAGDRAVAGFVAWMKGPEGVAIAVAGPYRSLPGGR
ncbi:MAG: hypothetical protein JWO65_2292, partial [Sphingomonas bacterium]|nr:hypothetical protein [Sphingomonas bacterium]